MTEVWLRSNRRVLVLAMVPVAALGGLGLGLKPDDWWSITGVLKAGCLGIALLLLAGLVRQFLQPRIAYREGQVLFFLKAGSPVSLPIHFLEAFFQGEGLAHLPGKSKHHAKSVNLIARLSQRETDWHERAVKPALGRWAEGYVTIRGTWCEPITGEVIRRLNRRLAEVSRAQQAEPERDVEA